MEYSWEEHTETFKLTLGILRNKHYAQQNFKNLPSWKQSHYTTGKFRRIKSRNQPTIIKLGDGGIVGYRVPAYLVSKSWNHVTGMERWVEKYEHKLPKVEDVRRGVSCVRKYAYWVKYNKDKEPKASGDFIEDGEIAQKFFEYSQPLWNSITDIFPGHVLARVFRDLTQFELKDEQKRLCGLWPGCAVNVGRKDAPVETKPHRDVTGFFRGMSCLCPFGQFTDGGLILWELDAIIELQRGDLFFFTDHLLNHSNEKAQGVRHSVVAFMENKVWTWMQERYEFTDYRVGYDTDRRKAFRETKSKERYKRGNKSKEKVSFTDGLQSTRKNKSKGAIRRQEKRSSRERKA